MVLEISLGWLLIGPQSGSGIERDHFGQVGMCVVRATVAFFGFFENENDHVSQMGHLPARHMRGIRFFVTHLSKAHGFSV